MPYASRAQQGLFHSPNSPVGPSVVKKFDQESKGQHGLPYHKAKKPLPGDPPVDMGDAGGDYQAMHGHPPEDEPGEPEEEALMHIHRTILGRMGEKLAARMPQPPKPVDLPAGDEPPQTPAKAHLEKLKAHLARKG